MPAPQIAEEEKQAALQRADPSFLCKMSERNVPELYQALLAHAGFLDAQAFSRMHADEEKVRSDLESGLGIDPDDGLAAKALLANLVAVWASCRVTVEVHDKAKASAEAASETWLIASHEHDDLRQAWEAAHYELEDFQCPSVALVSGRLEALEKNLLQAEEMQDISSIAEGEADSIDSRIGSDGYLRLRKTAVKVALPTSPEELQLRHTRL